MRKPVLYFPMIRNLREEACLTQFQVASSIGVDRAVYSRYENGMRRCPTEVIMNLARFYDVPPDDILRSGVIRKDD